MNNTKRHLIERLIAGLLVCIMVFNLMPPTSINVFAETPEHPDAVTVSVVDEDGNPVEGAGVVFQVNSVVGGDGTPDTLQTDVNGVVEVLTEAEFVPGDQSLTATVGKAGYLTDSTTLNAIRITSGVDDFKVVLQSAEIKGITITPYTGTYDEIPHLAATIEGVDEATDTVTYQLGSEPESDTMPEITDANTYSLKVNVTRTDGKSFTQTVAPKIEKADQAVSFTDSAYVPNGKTSVALDKATPTNNIYDFAAAGEGAVTYEIVNSKDNTAIASAVASIDPDGKLTVQDSVYLRVIATGTETPNYKEGVVKHDVMVNVESGGLIAFSGTPPTQYTLGEKNGVVSDATASKKYTNDNGVITYEIDNKEVGVSINENTGKVTVTDYAKLGEALLAKDGNLSIVVTANKGEGTIDGEALYGADLVNYTVEIGFLNTPANPYEIEETKEASGWYATDITVTPKDSTTYDISKTCDLNGFGAKAIYDDEGSAERYIFLRDRATGRITTKILLEDVKIDKSKPDVKKMKIEYSPTSLKETVALTIKHGFYTPYVDITFTAEDEGAGIDYFEWEYTQELGTSGVNVGTDSGKLNATIDGNTATATLRITAKEAQQFRGNLKFKATDKVGFVSDVLEDTGYVFVVDTIAPTRTVEFETPVYTQGQQKYYTGDTTVTFKINEANFFQDDVHITVSKDKGVFEEIKANWQDINVDEHEGTLVLSGDGDYVIKMSYEDKSTNVMQEYTSDVITIDTTKPDASKMKITYSPVSLKDTVKSVIEHGFYNPYVEITFTAEDVGAGIDYFDWEYTKETGTSGVNVGTDSGKLNATIDGNKATATLRITAKEANQFRGNIKLTATDKVGFVSDVLEDTGYVFVVDTIAPTRTVEFETPVYTQGQQKYYTGDTIVTFKINEANFFQDDVHITVSKDKGVFEEIKANWQDINVDEHEGTIVLSGDGDYVIKMTYEDKSTNAMQAYTSDVITIDTTKPDANKMTITYSPVSLKDTVKSVIEHGFYNPYVEITFTAEDVGAGIDYFDWEYTKELGTSGVNIETDHGRLVATSNGNKATAILKITAEQARQFRGNIKLTATDKVGFVSDVREDTGYVFVVDTIAPTRTVEFEVPVNKVGQQKYYAGDTTVTFKIKEANFFKEDVRIMVSKDKGTFKDTLAKWKDINVDEHVGTIVLSGDGDYVIKMTYEDKSENAMQVYTSDVITIDTTKPVVDFRYDPTAQSTTFIVTEHNFRPEDITVAAKAKDNKGNKINIANITSILRKGTWSRNGDTNTITISEYANGIYEFEMFYEDIAKLKAVNKTYMGNVIDHKAPTAPKIEYSTSIVDKILSTISLGFYNPTVEVTFTSYEDITAVDCFSWSYAKQADTSDVNKPTDVTEHQVLAVQDPKDKSKYTGTIELTADEAKQFRGFVGASATDLKGNTSNKVTDSGKVVVVDTIAPTMNVAYSEANRIVNGTMFYNKTATATFTVTEANFFLEDVKVMVTKDGGVPYQVVPNWTNVNADVNVGTIDISALENHTGDGDYVIYVAYMDKSTNKMNSYTSGVIVIDTTTPVVDVSYENKEIMNTMKDADNNDRQYFNKMQTAKIVIDEHNFDPNEVNFSIVAKDVEGNEVDVNQVVSKSPWSRTGDRNTIQINYFGDANYTFGVEYTDLATNVMSSPSKNYFSVDQTMPENLTISYSTSLLETILEAASFGFYNGKMTVTITADDATTGIHGFEYGYKKAGNVSSKNEELLAQALSDADITYTNAGRTATAKFEVPKSALNQNNQFHGTVEFTTKDRSENLAKKEDTKKIVVDNISPTATVSYSAPINTMNGIAYYNGDVSATVVIDEANFYGNDVLVSVARDGGATYQVTPTWVDNSADVHTGSFQLSGDGDYFVNITYKDKSNNEMAKYTSTQLTIDTKIDTPIILINGQDGNGKAFKGDVVPSISFADQNYSDYKLTLVRTSFNEKNVDVTDKFIGKGIALNDKGATGSFDSFEKDASNDGIYNLTVNVKDKAGHESTATAIFTVNRFGSVYEYDDYLTSLIKDGGTYIQSVEEDLIITEYNADKLVSDSLIIGITRDGKPISETKYEATPAVNDQVAVGESGWFEYQYTISKSNFEEDGIYKVSVSSEDATGNKPETTNYEDKSVLFSVDSTAPELTSITGLEQEIINAQEVNVNYDVYDTIGLKSVQVYLGGKQVGGAITNFSEDLNNYAGSFKIGENANAQNVRIVAEDLAGNITDTDSNSFSSAYAFQKMITVSTNAFVRWYANKVLFWGAIGGSVVVVGGAAGFISFRRRKMKLKSKDGNKE